MLITPVLFGYKQPRVFAHKNPQGGKLAVALAFGSLRANALGLKTPQVAYAPIRFGDRTTVLRSLDDIYTRLEQDLADPKKLDNGKAWYYSTSEGVPFNVIRKDAECDRYNIAIERADIPANIRKYIRTNAQNLIITLEKKSQCIAVKPNERGIRTKKVDDVSQVSVLLTPYLRKLFSDAEKTAGPLRLSLRACLGSEKQLTLEKFWAYLEQHIIKTSVDYKFTLGGATMFINKELDSHCPSIFRLFIPEDGFGESESLQQVKKVSLKGNKQCFVAYLRKLPSGQFLLQPDPEYLLQTELRNNIQTAQTKLIDFLGPQLDSAQICQAVLNPRQKGRRIFQKMRFLFRSLNSGDSVTIRPISVEEGVSKPSIRVKLVKREEDSGHFLFSIPLELIPSEALPTGCHDALVSPMSNDPLLEVNFYVNQITPKRAPGDMSWHINLNPEVFSFELKDAIVDYLYDFFAEHQFEEIEANVFQQREAA